MSTVTASILPSRFAVSTCRTTSKRGRASDHTASMQNRSLSRANSTSSRVASTVGVMGFSTSTFRPASRASRAWEA